MTQLAKDLWKRLVPQVHFWAAGLGVAGFVSNLKPGLGMSAGIATVLLLEAYNRMTYSQED